MFEQVKTETADNYMNRLDAEFEEIKASAAFEADYEGFEDEMDAVIEVVRKFKVEFQNDTRLDDFDLRECMEALFERLTEDKGHPTIQEIRYAEEGTEEDNPDFEGRCPREAHRDYLASVL